MSDPLVAVIVSAYVPATDAVQLNVAVNEPVPLAGEIPVQVKPELAVTVSVTVPLNPFRGVTVTVQLIDEPTVVDDGLHATVVVKSWKLKFAVAVCTRDPLVPVIVRA